MTDENKAPEIPPEILEIHSVETIKHLGDPTRGWYKGILVERKDAIVVPEYGRPVKCTPYDNHFVFENPLTDEGEVCYLCTCGSVAVITPQITGDFVCLFHLQMSYHQTRVINITDFEKGKIPDKIRLEDLPG